MSEVRIRVTPKVLTVKLVALRGLPAAPTQEQINTAVTEYMDDHPESQIPDGSVTDAKLATTGVKSELHDIRVGADGTTYSTAGDAVRGQVDGLQSDFHDISDWLGFPTNVFDANDFYTSNATNWTLIKTKTSITIIHNNTFSTGSPRCILDLPAGSYKFNADFSGSSVDLFQLNKNGSYLTGLYNNTEFTIESNNTYQLIFYSTVQTTFTITDISIIPLTHFGIIEEMQNSIDSLDKKWSNKKWVCVGDSLTEVNSTSTKRYYNYVKDITGINVVNMGVSGSGYARLSGESKAFYQRISSCPTDADVITIFGSFNDLGAGIPMGSSDDTGTTTIGGCINTTIDNLQAIIPLANVGIVSPTPWDTAKPATSGQAYNYVELLKNICFKRSIPFLNLWICSNLRPWDADFRALAYSKDSGSGTHPDETGHAIIAPRFKAFLESLLI